MDTQHVEFTRANTPMTDMPATDDPPTAGATPFVRPEHPIVISTITPREGYAILRQVINNDTATLSRLLNDLAARDKTIPGKILVQARDRLGRNALHVALLLDDKDTLSTHARPPRSRTLQKAPFLTTAADMLSFLLHNSILPAVYPSLKRVFLNQVTRPDHGGDNPALYACRLAKSFQVVRALMAAGGALLGVRNELGFDGLQCVVGPPVLEVRDVRERGDRFAGARLLRGLVESRMFRLGGVLLYGSWAGDREV